jgi:hypothetical protein
MGPERIEQRLAVLERKPRDAGVLSAAEDAVDREPEAPAVSKARAMTAGMPHQRLAQRADPHPGR